ncbi:MAG: glycosyltransferase family 39 protein [SAR324 cluster bacterium]|nr:glycosyltransferase family 39 protein [SAR324 cluster bacterium]
MLPIQNFKKLFAKSQDRVILTGIVLAAGISLLNLPAYAPALNINDSLDDILRLLLVLGGMAFIITKIQQKWNWSNRQCLTFLALLVFAGIVTARPDWEYWYIFLKASAILGITLCSIWSLGNTALHFLQITRQDLVGYDWLACSLGAALLSATLFWVGWGIGIAPEAVILIVTGSLLLVFIRKNPIRTMFCFQKRNPAFWTLWEWLGILCLFRIGMTLLIARGGSGALSPVTGFDAVWYRMSTPQMWLQQGAIGFFNPNGGDFSPGLVESFFMIGLAFQNEIAAKAMHALLAVLSVGACWVLGNVLGGRKVALLAALLYCLLPEFLNLARYGYVDAAGAGFLVLAVCSAMKFLETQKPGWIWITGLLCGGLAAFRYQGLLLSIVITAVLGLFLLCRKASFRNWLKIALIVVFTTTLTGSGWYIRNWVDLGNPVYPFAQSVFHGQYFAWDEEDSQQIQKSVESFGYPLSVKNFFLSPIRFYQDSKKLDATPESTHGVVPVLGWTAMIFGFFWRKTRFIAGIFGLCWLSWFAGSQISRYSLPFMGLAAVLGANLIGQIQRFHWRYGAAVLILLLMLSVNKRSLEAQPYPILLPEERLAHLRKNIRFFPLVEYLQQHAEPDSCLYTINAPAWFYYPNQCLRQQRMGGRYRIFTPRQTGFQLLPPDQLSSILCELNIEYLAINAIPFGNKLPAPLTPEAITNLHDPEYEGMFELLKHHNRAVLYRFSSLSSCSAANH